MRSFIQLMQSKELAEKNNSHFNLMIEELDRANSIISEYLSLARTAKTELKLQNLNGIIKAIYPLLSADAIKENKMIELKLSDIPNILLNEKEIRQVILNLAKNGLEAMEPGGLLTITTDLKSDKVVLTVEDEGMGIDEELLDKVGTPFFTTKSDGTGLGLPVCYNIVKRHNASLNLDSKQGKTTFAISFNTNSAKSDIIYI